MTKTACAVELFCGCGGMSTGLSAAGMDVRLGIELNAAAADAFDYNHSHLGTRALNADIRQVDGDRIREEAGLGRRRLNLLVGGPPCQPFSIIGKRRALDDERGDLVLEYVRLLGELEPDAFVFENVANFARIQDGKVADMVISTMERHGYATNASVLDASEYGVPQMRKRFFILGIKAKKPASFPVPTHGPHPLLGQKPIVTCRDALDDLPDVDTKKALRFRNHEGTTHSPAMLKMFAKLKPGTRDPKSHHDRLHADRPSYTLRAGNGNFSPLRPIHYRFDRVISVRESARIQTFPDHFAWPDDMSRLQQYRQVGNAVPPLLARILATDLARQLGFSLDPEVFGRPSKRKDRMANLTLDELIAKREQYIRGASIGRS